MTTSSCCALLTLLCAAALGSTPAIAGITLAADEAPIDPPWTQPATLAVVRENGENAVTADLVLKYRSAEQTRANADFATKGSYALGVYLHRAHATDTSKNDRGIQASYTGLLIPDWSNDGPVGSLGYSIKLSTGKGLVEVEPTPGTKALVDKTKHRLVVALGGYLQPPKPKGSSPHVGARSGIVFFDGGPSVYVDESRGSGVAGTGRLTGVAAKLAANYAPLGLTPVSVGKLAVVPTLRVAAQHQRDTSATGTRSKDSRSLYSAELALLFAQPEEAVNKLVPSLVLSRSVGADVLTGRAQSARTELTLGLTF